MFDRITRIFILAALSTSLLACTHGRVKDPEDWNKRDRGALIGGVSGSALGAAVGSQSGNTAGGAVIGGAAGLGAGALIGNEIDKQDEDDDK
jgi:uncharacterized protein YcfJ